MCTEAGTHFEALSPTLQSGGSRTRLNGEKWLRRVLPNSPTSGVVSVHSRDGVQAVPRETPDHILSFHGGLEAVASQAEQQRSSSPSSRSSHSLGGSLWPRDPSQLAFCGEAAAGGLGLILE